MLRYEIFFTRKAQKQLDKIPDKSAISIVNAILKLQDNPRPSGCKKLKGSDAYRIRSGKYRIIYEIFDSELLIDIIMVGHRSNIYKWSFQFKALTD